MVHLRRKEGERKVTEVGPDVVDYEHPSIVYVVLEEKYQNHSKLVAVVWDLHEAYDAIMDDMREKGYSAPAGFNEHKLMQDREERGEWRMYSEGSDTPYAVYMRVVKPYPNEYRSVRKNT